MRVEISNRVTIYGASKEFRDKIKASLTFDNPAYKNAMRFSKYAYTRIPKYVTYYDEFSVSEDGERKKVISVPIGATVNYPEVAWFDDLRKQGKVTYPRFLLDLREDQIRAEESYLSSYEIQGLEVACPRSIIQLPTGKGKSILALHIAQRLKAKTLILVHKDDLVIGWTKDAKLCFGEDFEVGIIKAKKRKVGEQVTIATVQTLSRMSADELSQYTSQFDLVVQDEVHHIGINIFNVIDKFSSIYKLGLSATPTRSDGLNYVFDLFFGGLCYKYDYSQADEDISQVEVIVKSSNFKYEPFLYNGMIYNLHSFAPSELPEKYTLVRDIPYEKRPQIPFLNIDSEMVLDSKYMCIVCKDIIKEYREGHSCIALFNQKEHIRKYRDFLKQFIPENQILLYYGDAKESSEELMQKAESKECLVTLATYAKATEGTNVKSWEVEFLVSSLNNEKNVEQATGRIRRVKKGKLNPVRVYDYKVEGYSIQNHYSTRLNTYNRLHYIVKDPNGASNNLLFSRGFKKSLL